MKFSDPVKPGELRQVMKARKWSTVDVAERFGVSRVTVYRWLRGTRALTGTARMLLLEITGADDAS